MRGRSARVTAGAGAGYKPFRLRARNASPEAAIQRDVVEKLRAYLPDQVWFTCSLSGIRLPMHTAVEAKRMGMERGAPDLSFVFLDGETRYIEVKAPGQFMSPEQAALKRALGDRMLVCRSWVEVKAALTAWMAPYGLTWLTDTESYKREIARRAAAETRRQPSGEPASEAEAG